MIDGVLNFRDLGGLQTQDGRVVKPGCLYRCGALDSVSNAGMVQMAQLGLRTYFDLRSSPERKARPARLLQHGGPRLVFHAHDRLTGALYHELERSGSEGELAQKRMLALYRDLPYSHRGAYRMLFQELLDGAWPMAFGCAAGKDRTGVAALLLLSALGVETAAIDADYLASGLHFEALAALFFTGERAAMSEHARLHVMPILRTDLAYLHAARAGVEIRSTGIERYLADELGVGPRELSALRGRLLI